MLTTRQADSSERQIEEREVLLDDNNIPQESRRVVGGWSSLLAAINPPNDFWGERLSTERQEAGEREEMWGLSWVLLTGWTSSARNFSHKLIDSLLVWWAGAGYSWQIEPSLGRESGKSDGIPSQHCNSNTPTIVTTFNLPHSIYITHNTVSRLMFTILCVLLTENTGDNYVLSSYIKILYIFLTWTITWSIFLIQPAK